MAFSTPAASGMETSASRAMVEDRVIGDGEDLVAHGDLPLRRAASVSDGFAGLRDDETLGWRRGT
jgi:hypothetical protein